MKAYNEQLLKNESIHRQVKDWSAKKLISEENAQTIRAAYPELPYRPHWFVWVGLFFFTWICISAGLLFLAPFISIPSAERFLPPIYGVVLYFTLNHLIKTRKLHFSGIDNVLQYACIGFFAPLLFDFIVPNFDQPWAIALLFLPLLLFFTYRYGEPLIALGTLLTILFIVASLAVESPLGKALLPFILMAIALLVAWALAKFRAQPKSFYWETALWVVQIAALSIVYLTGNYAVVREGNALLNDLPDPSPEIPYAGLFWLFTFLIPLVYLGIGIRKKQLMYLIISIFFAVGSILTWVQYHPVISGPWLSVLLGGVGMGLAFFLIKYLKTERNGFISTPEPISETALFVGNIVATQLSSTVSDTQPDLRFGEGDFGGGGGEGSY
ncbi:hypothetical protein [Arundinibacter roseus]|uniref:DUF2157 domain-containing protein n=1 Tax=Arundinibacter roseus TaxID=2070510 RepID=A0A4R4KBY1_9BACT|nr:hypothetical protein [Arundinibacter roseus]TDB65123.1 hypothetical protein EZE20_10445 [Arundinibacter roseus]